MARKGKQRSDELRELSDEDLAEELEEAYRQLFTTRLQLSTRQLANTSLPRKIRHRLARIKTVQHERELAAASKPATES
ncbi:MAG: 50S ribosomal protein L29 [Dehalococcoidia bacterium]|nr:50S ribosomal protein L29 [Dehalococcoidia bacterium]